MPAHRIVTNLGMSWGSDEPNYREVPQKNPWAGVEEMTRTLAVWMAGTAGVLMATHALIFFLG